MIERIAEMVNEKRLEGISDIRDESDRDGMRIVIELKRDAYPVLSSTTSTSRRPYR
jgi:DNA gyrase subunit A